MYTHWQVLRGMLPIFEFSKINGEHVIEQRKKQQKRKKQIICLFVCLFFERTYVHNSLHINILEFL